MTGRKIPKGRELPQENSVRENGVQYSIRNLPREMITIDRSGRFVLPKKIRNYFATSRFEVAVNKGKIELIPVKPLRTLLGALPDIDIDAIRQEHEEEIEREDAN
jgi:bifunctional DNA-binding transcriptional regulator/antitoxin component of YhaV-PrlF toxin-antitoxin module